jgi:Acetyltransferase (GNAT) domain
VRYAEEAITLAAMERGEVSAEIPILVLNELFVLDRPRLEDAKAARRFALDPDAARYFGWTIEQARAQPDSHYEDGIRQFAREWNDGTRFELTIRRRSDGEPVGSVELRPRGQSRSDADVSYMVAVELRGQVLHRWRSKPCLPGGTASSESAAPTSAVMLKIPRRDVSPRSAALCWLGGLTMN